MHPSGSAEPIIRHLVTSDGDELLSGAAGVRSGHVVRTGRGHDLAVVTAIDYGDVHLAVAEVGFPIAGEGVNPDDCLSLFTVLDGPAWVNSDGVTLSPGDTVIYPPGAARSARDPGGVRTAGTVVPLSVLESAADVLGVDPDVGAGPTVVRGGPIWTQLSWLAEVDVAGGAARAAACRVPSDALIGSAIATACSETPTSGKPRRGADDGDLVRATAQYLQTAATRIVPMLTLCRHIGVSERRLQIAFRNRLGLTPNTFMRLRALQAAHRDLLHRNPEQSTVARIARDAGFWHLGRFSSLYRSVYGEHPSSTLRRPGSAVPASVTVGG